MRSSSSSVIFLTDSDLELLIAPFLELRSFEDTLNSIRDFYNAPNLTAKEIEHIAHHTGTRLSYKGFDVRFQTLQWHDGAFWFELVFTKPHQFSHIFNDPKNAVRAILLSYIEKRTDQRFEILKNGDVWGSTPPGFSNASYTSVERTTRLAAFHIIRTGAEGHCLRFMFNGSAYERIDRRTVLKSEWRD